MYLFASLSRVRRRVVTGSCVAAALMFSAAAYAAATLDAQFHAPSLTAESDAKRVVALADDSFLVFNGFKQLDGAATEGLVKFKADGTRDTSFQFPRGYVEVVAVAPLGNGQLIVAAHREEKSGRKSYPILRVNANGTIDSSFNAGDGADDVVRSITIDNNGKILVGGFFSTFSGAARPFLVRLNGNGSLDTTLQPIALGPTYALRFQLGLWANVVVQPDGKILIGGEFTTVNGTAPQSNKAYGLARLNNDGTLDTSFVPTGYSMRMYFNDGGSTGTYYPVLALALDSQQRVLVGGRVRVTDISNALMVRLTSTGAFDKGFGSSNPNTGTEARAITLPPNGDILAAGQSLYRYSADGTPLSTFQQHIFSSGSDPTHTPTDSAEAVTLQSDGKILVAGPRYVDGQVRSGIARFDASGNLDALTLGEFQNQKIPIRLASRSDAKSYVEGSFDRVDGVLRGGLARLYSDGTLDAGFDPARFGVNALGAFVLQPDDKVVIDGYSGNPDSQAQLTRRLNTDDSTDSSFAAPSPPAYEMYLPLLEQSGDYLDGFPQSPQLAVYGAIVYRILANGSYDDSFAPSFPFDFANMRDPGGFLITVYSGENRALAALADGKILVCYYDKNANYNLVRLNHDGSADSSFHAGLVHAVPSYTSQDVRDPYDPATGYPTVKVASPPLGVLSKVLPLPDGSFIVVGAFQSYNGVAAGGIIRLLSDGTIDNTFAAGAGAQWTSTAVDASHVPRVDQIEQQSDGKFLITGNFEAFDGVTAPGIALLNSDGSIDKAFAAPIELRGDDPYGAFPVSQLAACADGTFLVAGHYAEPGAQDTRSISHITTGVPFTSPTPIPTPDPSASPSPTTTPSPTASPTPMPTPAAARFANISTRMRVETGDDVLIGGFIVTGSAPKKVLIRAIGPSLPLADKLLDTTLELHTSDGQVIFNDNWQDSQQTEIAATGVPPTSDLESAIIATLPPGGHTAIVRGSGNATGVALVEVYDLEQSGASGLANISTRGRVETGDNVMIGGIIVTGQNPAKVLVRAIGPSLPVPNALQNPLLELHDSNGNVTVNDDWKELQQAEIIATGAAPSDDRESAIVTTLVPGSYTAIVRGVGDTTGVALVEAFNLQ